MCKLLAVAAVLVATLAVLTSCSGSDSGASGSGTTNNKPTSIDITIKNGNVTPQGERVKATVNRPITLNISADKAGQIHVHSSPKEQEFEYRKGSSTFHVTPIQAPGQVVVESHTLNKTLFTLVAR